MIKTSNLKNLKFWLASKICDESNLWLTEIEIRMSNSNWLQKFLFWTNRIQLSQRLKFDWSIRRAQKKYFYLYVVQVLFKSSFRFFVKVWFSCCIATFRFKQRLFFENIEITSLNVWRKMLLIWCEKRFLEEFSIEKWISIWWFELLMIWMFWWFNIDWFNLLLLLLQLRRSKICRKMFRI